MHSRISQFSEENWHKQLIIKQGINKHREMGNTIEELFLKMVWEMQIVVNEIEKTFTK